MSLLKKILYLGLDPSRYPIGQAHLIHWPIIQIVPRSMADQAIQQALEQFSSYSHIVLTSQTAVHLLWCFLGEQGVGRRLWQDKTTIVVGHATGAAASTYGITCLQIAQEATAEGVIATLAASDLKEAFLFWPHSEQARPAIENALLLQRVRYCSCIFYAPLPTRSPPPVKWELCDEIVFTSPSTVSAFLQLCGTIPPLAQCRAIGPITARALEEARQRVEDVNL